jgi:hypothetical protein
MMEHPVLARHKEAILRRDHWALVGMVDLAVLPATLGKPLLRSQAWAVQVVRAAAVVLQRAALLQRPFCPVVEFHAGHIKSSVVAAAPQLPLLSSSMVAVAAGVGAQVAQEAVLRQVVAVERVVDKSSLPLAPLTTKELSQPRVAVEAAAHQPTVLAEAVALAGS